MEKILIIEDTTDMRKLIALYLIKEGYEVIEAENGIEGLKKIKEKPDLVVLDVMMPMFNGWEVLKEIRMSSDIPVVMLTALGDDTDQLQGFELGADEYITKPFKAPLLIARIKALLKRHGGNVVDDTMIKHGKIMINKESHQIWADDVEIELSPKEYDLLVFLAENAGIALSREQILDSVWGMDYFGGLRTVDTHIKRIRNKIEILKEYVHSVRGVGYRFSGE